MKTDAQTRKAANKVARELKCDIKTMESLQWQAQWLNSRDSNCGAAASLTDAIEVLIDKAVLLHKEELREFESTYLAPKSKEVNA